MKTSSAVCKTYKRLNRRQRAQCWKLMLLVATVFLVAFAVLYYGVPMFRTQTAANVPTFITHRTQRTSGAAKGTESITVKTPRFVVCDDTMLMGTPGPARDGLPDGNGESPTTRDPPRAEAKVITPKNWRSVCAENIPTRPPTASVMTPRRRVSPRAKDGRVSLLSTNICPGLNITVDFSEKKHFHNVTNTTYLYSAYEHEDSIRVIALLELRENYTHLLFCHLWYDVTVEVLSVSEASIQTIKEHHTLQYTAAFVICDLPEERGDLLPVAVTVGPRICELPSTEALPIEEVGHLDLNFTVFLGTINREFNKVHQVVEMIEFNRILGADKFVFYNYSIGPQLDRVLLYYQSRGLVDVYPWDLPVARKKVHYFGQLAVLNDCLYRYKNRTRYVVVTDIDEFIVPAKFSSWTGLIHDRRSRREANGRAADVLQFRNTFFRREFAAGWWAVPSTGEADEFKSVVLKTMVRELLVYPHGDRSKYMADPRRLRCLGVHQVWDKGTGGTVDEVEAEEAMVYHYRSWNQTERRELLTKDVSVVRRFGEQLMQRVKAAWRDLEENLGVTSEDFDS